MTATKTATTLSLMLGILCGCAPDASSPGAVGPPQGLSRRNSAVSPEMAGVATSPLSPTDAASYEVIIASAQADRVRSHEQCDAKPPAERKSCREAADEAFDQAEGAADSADSQSP